MALDEAMLEFVVGEPSVAVLRIYQWSEPSLSLGYFQNVARAEADVRWRGLPLVRRPTGGGAIVHDHELTYALVVPRSHPFAREAGTLYQAVHDSIAGLLLERGIAAKRRRVVADTADERPFLCFGDCDVGDVVIGTTKVVGSAQRRRAGAILQHGSLLLSRSRYAPELPGVADVWNDVPEVDWGDELERRIPETLGLTGSLAAWPGALTQRANELEMSIYQNDAWNRRR